MEPRLKYLDSQISGCIKIYKPNRKILNKQKINLMVFCEITSFSDESWETNSIMAFASFFIMMMFITLEISPVLVKLISQLDLMIIFSTKPKTITDCILRKK